MRRSLSSNSAGRLVHHLDEEESDILKPLAAKLNDDIQRELALQFISAEPYASEKPHPELSKKAFKLDWRKDKRNTEFFYSEGKLCETFSEFEE